MPRYGGGDRHRWTTDHDAAARIGWHIIDTECRAADNGPAWIHHDGVSARGWQRFHIGKKGSGTGYPRRYQDRAIGIDNREVRTAKRGRDRRHVQTDALACRAVKPKAGILPRHRGGERHRWTTDHDAAARIGWHIIDTECRAADNGPAWIHHDGVSARGWQRFHIGKKGSGTGYPRRYQDRAIGIDNREVRTAKRGRDRRHVQTDALACRAVKPKAGILPRHRGGERHGRATDCDRTSHVLDVVQRHRDATR